MGIVPPTAVTRASSSSGGDGTPESSPSPTPSAQDLPDVPNEIATPIFILEERAKVPGPSTRGRGKKGHTLPPLDIPPAQTFTPMAIPGMVPPMGPGYVYSESCSGSMWSGMRATEPPSSPEWGSHTSLAASTPHGLPFWETAQYQPSAGSSTSGSFPIDDFTAFDPPLPSAFGQLPVEVSNSYSRASTSYAYSAAGNGNPYSGAGMSFSFDELGMPLNCAGFPGFPDVTGALPGGSASVYSSSPSSRQASPPLSSRASSPPLSSRPTSPAPSATTESTSASADDTPACTGRSRKRLPETSGEPRVSRTGRVVNAPKRDDAGFQPANKRRKAG